MVFQIEDEPATVLRAGDAFYEPEGVVISHFDAQDDGVTFLACFPLGEGQEPGMTSPES